MQNDYTYYTNSPKTNVISVCLRVCVFVFLCVRFCVACVFVFVCFCVFVFVCLYFCAVVFVTDG